MGQRRDRVKAFFFTTEFPSGDQRPSRLWEITHPRQAEAFWAGLEEEEELRIAAEAEEIERHRAYERFADSCDYGIQKSLPPDSRALDREIEKFSGWYPEVSELEEMRARYEAGELDLGDLDDYEPPPWSDQWRTDHSEYEREFYWETEHPELCTDLQLRAAHIAWLKTPEGRLEQEVYERDFESLNDEREADIVARQPVARRRPVSGRGLAAADTRPALEQLAAVWGEAPGEMQAILDRAGIGADMLAARLAAIAATADASQEPDRERGDGVREYSRERGVRGETGAYEMAIDEGRFQPTPHDLGITDQPQNELGQQPLEREVRGEPDPYDPLYFPSYRYWAPGREAG